MKKTKVSNEAEAAVYCGPTFQGRVAQWAVFLDGIPEALTKLQQECPAMKALTVPLEQLAEVRQKITMKEAPWGAFFDAAEQYKRSVN